jgi:hypothetical protein
MPPVAMVTRQSPKFAAECSFFHSRSSRSRAFATPPFTALPAATFASAKCSESGIQPVSACRSTPELLPGKS